MGTETRLPARPSRSGGPGPEFTRRGSLRLVRVYGFLFDAQWFLIVEIIRFISVR